MPFNVGESINYVASKFTESSIVKKIIKNPFYNAVFIVVIISLIILFVFRNVDFSGEDESLGKLVFRSGIYILLLVTAMQFLHNKIWIQETNEKMVGENVKTVFGGVEKRPVGIVKPNISPDMAAFNVGYQPKGNGVINISVGGLSTSESLSARTNIEPEKVPAVDIM